MPKEIPVDYKIDKGVPIPVDRRSYSVLPLKTMAVGESFVFPREKRSTVQSRASHIKKATGKEFSVRVINELECRIWRTQ